MLDDKKYPEHAKLQALGGANQIVGDFIDWLGANGLTICEQLGNWHGDFVPTRKSQTKLIGEFFEIDNDVLMAEKDAMLDEIRASNAA